MVISSSLKSSPVALVFGVQPGRRGGLVELAETHSLALVRVRRRRQIRTTRGGAEQVGKQVFEICIAQHHGGIPRVKSMVSRCPLAGHAA